MALLGLFNRPDSSIFSMPSSSKLDLSSKGRESVFHFTTTMVVVIVLIWFSSFMVHFPMMGRLWLSTFNFIVDSLSAIPGLSVCSFQNWYSTMMFVSALVSSWTLVSMPFMRMVQVFRMPWLIAMWIVRWWMKHFSLNVSLKSDFWLISSWPNTWWTFQYICLALGNFFVHADHVMFGDLLGSEFCLAVGNSLSFLNCYLMISFFTCCARNVGRFANVQFTNILRWFANVFSQFANVVKSFC